MRRIVLTLVLSVVAWPAVAANGVAQQRPPLDIEVFARIGPPGQPEPVAIGPDGRVYVGTNQLGHGDKDAPSKVFAFTRTGELVRDYTLEGQPLDRSHGIQGIAIDADGLLYVLDRSADPRVVVLDPATGEQRRYASFRDVPRCGERPVTPLEPPPPPRPPGDCSRTQLDGPAGPDYATFSPDGDLYVSDIDQGLIWRVPRGGGEAQIWLSDQRLESAYGPNGIQFMADGRTLLFANTASNPSAGNSATGRLYTVPVLPDATAGVLTQVWESRPGDAPDGIAIARSGNVYVALAGTNQVLLLSPSFGELARAPGDPAANEAEEVPVDAPGSLAFDGDRLLVSNHSAVRGDPSSWAILDVFAGEPGLPLHHPRISTPRLRLAARATRARRSRRVRVHARITRHLGAIEVPVAGALVRAGRVVGRTDARGTVTLRLRRRKGRRIAVRATTPGFAGAATVARVPPRRARAGGQDPSRKQRALG